MYTHIIHGYSIILQTHIIIIIITSEEIMRDNKKFEIFLGIIALSPCSR